MSRLVVGRAGAAGLLLRLERQRRRRREPGIRTVEQDADWRLHGSVVAGFIATKKGCSYFPFSGATLATLANYVRGYEQTKSSLHFDPEKPLPATLVRKLIKTRIAESKK